MFEISKAVITKRSENGNELIIVELIYSFYSYMKNMKNIIIVFTLMRIKI